MQLFMLALLGLGLVYYLAVEPFKGSSSGRYTPNMLMVPLLVVIAVPTGWSEFNWQRVDHKGTQIVREVSGNDDGVLRCQRLASTIFDPMPGSSGYVSGKRPEVAVVKFKPCLELQSYFRAPQTPTMAQSTAFIVLLHESFHVGGDYDETSTECRAHWAYLEESVKLGTEPEVALDHFRSYLRDYYPNMASKYHSADGCGGLHELAMEPDALTTMMEMIVP